MKKVTSADSLVTINHYKNLLTSEGIVAFIRNEHLGGILGEMPFQEVWPELWVENDLDYDRALQLIDSFVLDQSLIQDVEFNGSHQRIVRAAIAMARGLDIEVAAEGVETITQLEFLRSCNCDLAQGFLISRPIKAEKVSSILRSEIAGTRLLSRGMP